MARRKRHRGFSAVARSVAPRAGVSMKRARAIVAAGARKASAKAVRANPRLRRVSGNKRTRRGYRR